MATTSTMTPPIDTDRWRSSLPDRSARKIRGQGDPRRHVRRAEVPLAPRHVSEQDGAQRPGWWRRRLASRGTGAVPAAAEAAAAAASRPPCPESEAATAESTGRALYGMMASIDAETRAASQALFDLHPDKVLCVICEFDPRDGGGCDDRDDEGHSAAATTAAADLIGRRVLDVLRQHRRPDSNRAEKLRPTRGGNAAFRRTGDDDDDDTALRGAGSRAYERPTLVAGDDARYRVACDLDVRLTAADEVLASEPAWSEDARRAWMSARRRYVIVCRAKGERTVEYRAHLVARESRAEQTDRCGGGDDGSPSAARVSGARRTRNADTPPVTRPL